MTIKISVIIPVFNQALFISRCLRSLQAQTLKKQLFEVILINDGSTDHFNEEIKSFLKDSHLNLKVLENKKNEGLPFSANKGISQSNSKYIVRVDADDYVNKHFLSELLNNFEKREDIDALGCDYLVVDNNEKVLNTSNCIAEPIACGILFQRKHLLEIGMYDPDFKCNEEKELRIRFEKNYKIGRLSQSLYRYRRHENNLTNDKVFIKKYEQILRSKHNLKK